MVALKESDSSKSPGPDGFNFGWLKSMWVHISDKVLNFFNEFHSSGFIQRGVNSSFIVLIPKKHNSLEIGDFRPISLINCSLKLLLKVMTNRLKPFLGACISEEQSAFISGRNINEGIFIVNEVIHSLKSSNLDGSILKIDFSKAYDSVDWSCLFHSMSCLNMGEKWISWVLALLQSSRMSVLINGSPTEEFSPSRGLRQGDPLAPYLFLIVGEILSKLISRAREKGLIKGLVFNEDKDNITHFKYADDTILFMNNTFEDIPGMKKIFLLFQVITGLTINFEKSQAYHTSNKREAVKSGIDILGCQFGETPFKYLGAWVGVDRKLGKHWQQLKSDFGKNLVSWKC